MNRLFWIAAALLLAVAVHTSFVLLAPSLTLDRAVARVSGMAQTNAFFILPRDRQGNLFPTYPNDSVIGICAFDVSDSKVDLTASLPPGFWTLTVYSRSGKVIYALNDRQSGTGSFTVTLSRAPGVLEMLTQSGGDDVSTTGWTVSAAEPRGYAILWQPVIDQAQRAQVIRAFEKTTCAAVG